MSGSRNIGRITGYLVLTFFFICSAGYFAYRMLLVSVPEYSGSYSVKGISSPVDIFRDSLGIPYIMGAKDTDGAFALGYTHAQERLFQMDMMRRAGEGRLAEILGVKALPFDRMFLTIGIDRISAKILANAHPETVAMLQAYADGVNAFIHANKNKLSIEFDVLNYSPDDWKPVNSIMIIRLMAWELNIAWWEDLAFTYIAQQVGKEKAQKLFPDFKENARQQDMASVARLLPTDLQFVETDKRFREFSGFTGTHIGSNNWVVSPARSQSGKPVIANDPHLAFQAPGKWFIASIDAGNVHAAGVTLPGVPGIVIGKNRQISWALTNVMADDADFYVERIDPQGQNYFIDGQWKPLQMLRYVRKVKDSAEAEINVMLTHRGPVISDIHPLNVLFPHGTRDNMAISMRWMGNEISDEYYAFYKINCAAGWNDFHEAVKNFTVPGQNFVYGDAAGNIGYVCGARLAVRSGAGGFALDGTTTANDWKGFIPASDMPVMFNPDAGYIATANNKVIKEFPHYISNLWEPSSRIERIHELMRSQEKFSTEDFKRFQMDVKSKYAEEITPYVVNAFKSVKVTDAQLKEAIQLLSMWDYRFEAESQTPSIYAMFYKYLLRNTFLDDLGPDLFNQFCFVANVPYRVIQKLLSDGGSEIFDNCLTQRFESRDEILRKSLVDALTELEKRYGTDVRSWQWGSIHQVSFKHAFHGAADMVDRLVDIGPFPIGGDGTTIANSEYQFFEYHGPFKRFETKQFENVLGPSMRFIFDFAQPDRMQIILPTGQSGNVFSGHYADMAQHWLRGKYVTLKTDRVSASLNREHLVLSPQ